MIGELWNRYWFTPTPVSRLCAFRILVMALVIYDVIGYGVLVFPDAALLTQGGEMRRWEPLYIFEVLGLQPIDLPTASVVYATAIGAALLGMLGVFTRVACIVAGILALYWTGLAYSHGNPHHDKVAYAFCLLALPFGPVGARLSLASLVGRVRRAKHGGELRPSTETSSWASVPLRVTQLTIAIGYGAAGLSKLFMGGLEWFNGYTLQGIMMGHDRPWSAFFSSHLWASQIMSFGVVATQALFPLVLVVPKSRWFFFPAAITMHLMTGQTMDTGPYMTLWFLLIAFLPLERVPAIVRDGIRSGGVARVGWTTLSTVVIVGVGTLLWQRFPSWSAVFLFIPALTAFLWFSRNRRISVIYDGRCGLCRRTIALLLGFDWCRLVEPLTLEPFEAVRQRYPELDHTACKQDMHAVDEHGRTYVGFDAYRALAWRLPLGVLIAPVLHLPPVAAVGHRIYRRVAARRFGSAYIGA